MDEWLANVYGTGSNQTPDLEKVAQMAILEKLANDEGYDLSGLSEEEAEDLANQIMADAASDGEEQGEEVPEEEMAKEAQAKFEEADFLGRVMAHSYTQELEKIAEHSAEDIAKFTKSREKADKGLKFSKGKNKGYITKGLPSARIKAEGAAHAVSRGVRKGADKAETAGRKVTGALSRAKAAIGRSGTYSDLHRAGGAVKGHLSKHQGKYMLGGLGAAAIGGGALAAHKAFSKSEKSKTASAFEKLAEDRANELLENDGEFELSGDENFDEALNARAIEMLQENGYTIE
jgi:hypothetical protein